MRVHSHTDRLLQIDHCRRRRYYGRQARINQLRVLLAVASVVYLSCVYWHWSHPPPSSPVWIDGVRVEVVEEDWTTTLRDWALRGGLLCAVTLFTLRFLLEAESGTNDDEDGVRAGREGGAVMQESQTCERDGDGSAAVCDGPRDTRPRSVAQGGRLSDILPPEASLACRRAHAGAVADKAERPAMPSVTKTATSGWPAPLPSRESEQRLKALPVRSSAELDRFLRCALDQEAMDSKKGEQAAAAATRQTDPLGAAAATTSGISAVRNVDGLRCDQTRALATTAVGRQTGIGITSLDRPAFAQEGLCVGYDTDPAAAGLAEGGAGGALADVARWHSSGHDERQWAQLGMTGGGLDRALGRARLWCSEVCRKLVCEIDECDRWFADKGIAGFGCDYSLQETITVTVPASAVPAPAAAGGFNAFAPRTTYAWGSNTSGSATSNVLAAQPTTQTITKLQALLQEKELVRTRPTQSTYDFDTVLHYEQRLALEGQLDLGLTFPHEGGTVATTTVQEKSARQQYIIRRLRTFAQQGSLVSYTGGGGAEEEGFRPGFPCDAHLLVHVIRTRVQGLGKLVGFSYQQRPQTNHNSIALCIGDIGEPFFYVRHQHAAGSAVQILHTQAGVQSLFEALALLVALVHTQYHDVYGDLRGTLSLRESGLHALIT